ncbi:MAG: SpoIIE family protein phosphatase [Planctomycetota bacterium]
MAPLMSGPLTLESVSGPESASHSVLVGRSAYLGREGGVEIRLDDVDVSPRHALVTDRGGRWIITDLGSRTGTRLNGVEMSPIRPVVLGEGDLVEIGPWTFRVILAATRGVPVTAEPSEELGDATVYDAELTEKAGERLSRLTEYVTEVNSARSEDDLAELTVRTALAGTGFPRAAVLRTGAAGDEITVVAARARDPGDAGAFGISRKLIREAMKGRLVRLSHLPEIRASRTVADLGIQSALCAPIRVGSSTAALLYLDARAGERGMLPDANDFCATLSVVCGLALSSLKRADLENRHRALKSELLAAREAQQLIVPATGGVCDGLAFSVRTHPGMVVAGDMFDVVPLPDRRVAVVIGDVTGAGIGAGILMVAGQANLHAALKRTGDPGEALEAVNDYIASRSAMNRFISMWVGVFDHVGRTVTYSDAGHGHWLVVRTDGRAAHPGATGGIPVGIDRGARYRTHAMPFHGGERVILFSDGVVEQRSPNGEPFGVERVRAEVCASGSASEDVERLFSSLVDFAGTEALDDDTTAASVEWHG